MDGQARLSKGKLMVAAFAGALVLAGCARVMGQHSQEPTKETAMVRSVEPAKVAPARVQPVPAARPATSKAKQRQATPAKPPTPPRSR